MFDPRFLSYFTAGDAGTNFGESYINVCVTILTENPVKHFNLLASTLRERHTRENICNVVGSLFYLTGGVGDDNKEFGTWSVGAFCMTERVSVTVSRIQRPKIPGVNLVYCNARRIDLLAQYSFEMGVKERFQNPFRMPIGRVRWQVSLKAGIDSVCLAVSTARWLLISEVCKWLC